MVYIAHGVTDQVEGPFGQGKKNGQMSLTYYANTKYYILESGTT